VTVALVVIPALAYRTPRVMPPWELFVLVVLPVAARLIAPDGVLASVTTYGAVAAIALLVAVELHQFTTVEMTPWFAILTVLVATMAAAVSWPSDDGFSTSTSNAALSRSNTHRHTDRGRGDVGLRLLDAGRGCCGPALRVWVSKHQAGPTLSLSA
jgi:membrane protein implicated in regulation of membrane protease activity